MRAHTKGKHEMGRRFAIVIGVAAAGVIALGAQTALAGGPHARPPAVGEEEAPVPAAPRQETNAGEHSAV
jgi:hypothetical protein